jgi:hypothetical protein
VPDGVEAASRDENHRLNDVMAALGFVWKSARTPAGVVKVYVRG